MSAGPAPAPEKAPKEQGTEPHSGADRYSTLTTNLKHYNECLFMPILGGQNRKESLREYRRMVYEILRELEAGYSDRAKSNPSVIEFKKVIEPELERILGPYQK